MSLLNKVKSYIPASSRSLHSMYAEVIRLREENRVINAKLDAIAELFHAITKIDAVEANVARCNDGIEALGGKLDAFESQAVGILWELYKDDDEAVLDAKERYFASMPKADGILRDRQRELAALLIDFDEICKKHNIKYFLAIGTLLGALRHEGFVPWDDDIDVGMMRQDIDKLISNLQDDARFEITVVYDQYVFCKQIRFKRKGAQEGDPFIDLFIYEYSRCETMGDLRSIKGIREELLSEFKRMQNEQPEVFPAETCVGPDTSTSTEAIQGLYNEYRQRAFDEGLYADIDNAKSIIWSIENLSFGDPVHIIPIQYFSDMRIATFEGSEYPILGNSEMLLSQHYGDWLKMPTDVYTHFKHDGTM